MRVVRLSLVLLSLSALTNHAAGDEKSQARELYQRGVEAFGKGKYQEARAIFSEGYALSHKKGFLYNMAECARLSGEKKSAYSFYRQYLEDAKGADNTDALDRCRELQLGPCEPARDREPPPAAAPAAAAPIITPAPETIAPTPAAATRLVATAPPPRARKRAWLWATIGAVSVSAIAVGLGLGLGLGNQARSPTVIAPIQFRPESP